VALGPPCYPLIVTDHASRFVLMCEALESTREDLAVTAFEQLFRKRGLPSAIRSDNGVPFADPNGLFNLSNSPSGGSDSASPSNASSPRQSQTVACSINCMPHNLNHR
jgi:hypothetical protein